MSITFMHSFMGLIYKMVDIVKLYLLYRNIYLCKYINKKFVKLINSRGGGMFEVVPLISYYKQYSKLSRPIVLVQLWWFEPTQGCKHFA